MKKKKKKKKQQVVPLTIEKNKSYRKQKTCHICKKQFSTDDKKYYKFTDNCHYTRI